MDPACPPRALPRPRWALLALLAAHAGCVHIRGTAEQPAIVNLRIEGLEHVSESELVARLATQESERSPPIPIIGPLIHQLQGFRQDLGKLEKPPPVPIVGRALYALRGSGTDEMVSLLDPEQLAVDRERVVAYLRDRGYYDAKVVGTQITAVGEGRADVTIQVDEGQPVRVTRIDVDGLESAPEARAALAKPSLRVGDVFTLADYDAFRDQIASALRNNGWALGEVSQEAQVLPEEHSAVVHYTAHPGSRYRFGPVLVAGTAKVSRDLVRQYATEEIRVGDWFDERKLTAAQNHVFSMGVFGGVRVNRGEPDEPRGIVPILVAVHEAPFRSVRLGPSLGVVSSSRIDASGLAGWTNRDFLGGLRKLDLSAAAGYAWLITKPKDEGPIAKLAANLSQPRLLRSVDLGAYVEIQRGLESGYQFWAERARISFPTHVTRRVTFVPSYSLEVYQLDHVSSFPDPNNPDVTLPSPLLAACTQSPSKHYGTCLLSYLEQRIEWDRRDDPLNTRRGFYTSLAVQEGGHVGGYGYQFLKIIPEARFYLPIGKRSVVAFRGRLGAFIPLSETRAPPTVALFEAGGANSMRGYGQSRLSPMACVRNSNGECTDQWYPVGGNGMAEYSAEYRFPVRGNLFGAVFGDAGYVSAPSAVPTAYREAFALSHLQWAAGFGIRYLTPVGPLRLDVAARLPDDLSPGVKFEDRFPPVPLGTHQEPIMALHLSIGEAY